MPNPADVLGVDPEADRDTIEAAYRNRVMETHPDAGGSAEEFKQVKNAYEHLVAGFETKKEGVGQVSGGNVTIGINCAHCGAAILNQSDGWYNEGTGEVYCIDCLIRSECAGCGRDIPAVQEQLDEDLYCSDCLVSTECNICGKSLTLSKDDYSQTGGDPICLDCGTTGRSTGKSDGPFTHCALCDSPIDQRKNAMPGGSTGEYYCSRCVVDSSCVSCGKSLTMTIEKFEEVNCKPVCGECANSNSGNKSKINDLLWAAIGLVLIASIPVGIGYWIIELGIFESVLSIIQANQEGISTVAGPTAVIIAVGIISLVRNLGDS